MNHVIAIHNNKGGVGKTMVSFNLAGASVEEGNDVLLVDFDEQGDATKLATGSPVANSDKTTRDLLLDASCSVHDIVMRTKVKNLCIAPGGKSLKGVDTSLSLDPDALHRFRDKIDEARKAFDLIIFDLPTPLGWTVRTAFATADLIFIPIQLEMTAIVNAAGVERLIESVQSYINPELRLGGYIINLCRPSSAHNEPVVQRQHFEFIRNHLGERLFKTVIYSYIIYQEARAAGLPITHYAPETRQAQTIRELYKEVCHVRQKVET